MQTIVYSLYLIATVFVLGYFIVRRDSVGLAMMCVALFLGGYLESMNAVAAAEDSLFYVRYSPEIIERTKFFGVPVLIAIGWSGFVGIAYFILTRSRWLRSSSGSWRAYVSAALLVPLFSLIFELAMVYSGTWTWYQSDGLADWVPFAIGVVSLSFVYFASLLIAWLITSKIPSLFHQNRNDQ